MNRRLWYSGAIAAGIAFVFAGMYAGAQQYPQSDPFPVTRTRTTTGTVVVQNADGTVVEQSPDGKAQWNTLTRQPGGFPEYRSAFVPAAASDPDTQKMLAAEQAAAQEARALTAEYAQADSDPGRTDAKARLREKLIAIFELQQKRRAHEIAKIEERLGTLKDTVKKRDARKDPIVDRRLDQLTGGIDELGWEETGLSGPNLYYTHPAYPVPSDPRAYSPSPSYVPTTPPVAVPPSSATPVPPPVPRPPATVRPAGDRSDSK